MTAPDDGLVRCDWAVGRPGGPDFELYRDYHDKEWGQPLHERVPLFERMSLEAFQSGLSWLDHLAQTGEFPAGLRRFRHREGRPLHRRRRGPGLMADQGIVRNRAKIEATIANARATADTGVDLSELLWSFAPAKRPRPASLADVPATTPESTAMARELKRRGFPLRRSHDRLRADAGDRDGRRSPAAQAGCLPRPPENAEPGGHVHLPARIGNNGGVNVQLTGQLESGGSARWRR